MEEGKNEQKNQYMQFFSIDDLFIKAEDLKMEDYTSSRKSQHINRNYDFLFSEDNTDRVNELVEQYYTRKEYKVIYSIFKINI